MSVRVFPRLARLSAFAVVRRLSPGEVLPYMGYIGMCSPKRVGFFSRFARKWGIDFGHFAAIWVINRVSIIVYSY